MEDLFYWVYSSYFCLRYVVYYCLGSYCFLAGVVKNVIRIVIVLNKNVFIK